MAKQPEVMVYFPGTWVLLETEKGKAEVKARIIETNILSRSCVHYKIAMWNGNTRTEATVHAGEVFGCIDADFGMERIGFIQPVAKE